MSQTKLARESIDLLLQEAYDGPPDPDATWFTTNAPETGVLGTIRHINAEQAAEKLPGVSHSIAQHVAHLIFSIDHALKHAKGERSTPEWDSSWVVSEPLDEHTWHGMQRALRESHLRMRMWVHNEEPFQDKAAVTSFIGSVAHAAYHLGAIRQLIAIIRARTSLAELNS